MAARSPRSRTGQRNPLTQHCTSLEFPHALPLHRLLACSLYKNPSSQPRLHPLTSPHLTSPPQLIVIIIIAVNKNKKQFLVIADRSLPPIRLPPSLCRKKQMEQHQLVTELCRVQDLVRELALHLHSSSPSSVDQCRRLAVEIVALTDHSIATAAATTIAPPCSGTPSPLSDAGSDHPAFSPKKRKATARWSGQVRVTATGGADDDGHSWRKYGQKDILGARHPRAYYRCTHRNSQGCQATKQVQRTDDDGSVFDVVYHGEHTCRPGAARRQSYSSQQPQPSQPQQHNPGAESLLQSLGARLTVATDAAGVAVAVPPMTPPESCPSRGAASPWSLASPVGSDSYPCLTATGYGELQEVLSGAQQTVPLDNEFMPQEYFGFDYQSFDMEQMHSLFFQ